jgi:hypothetical protein
MGEFDITDLYNQDWNKRLKILQYSTIDEDAFIDIEKDNPWFSFEMMPPLTKSEDEFRKSDTSGFVEGMQYIFAHIFGSFGYEQNFDKAESLIIGVYKNNPRPADNSKEMLSWRTLYGHLQIQLGTVYALKKEYIKAAYHFMAGVKTECVSLDKTYVDFMNYIMSKLVDMPKTELNYGGCGFSIDEPMGCCNKSEKAILMPRIAMEVIPAMEGNDGEVVAVHTYCDMLGRLKPIGHIKRLGSTSSKSQTHIIDMYETFVISKDYKLHRAVFFFDGYTYRLDPSINIANGFHIRKESQMRENYRINENK